MMPPSSVLRCAKTKAKRSSSGGRYLGRVAGLLPGNKSMYGEVGNHRVDAGTAFFEVRIESVFKNMILACGDICYKHKTLGHLSECECDSFGPCSPSRCSPCAAMPSCP